MSRGRIAKFDPNYVKRRLRVVVVKDMLNWMVVVCPAEMADRLKRAENHRGENLYPWPVGHEHACICYRLEFEPGGGRSPEDDHEFRQAAEKAAETLRRLLGLDAGLTFLGDGI